MARCESVFVCLRVGGVDEETYSFAHPCDGLCPRERASVIPHNLCRRTISSDTGRTIALVVPVGFILVFTGRARFPRRQAAASTAIIRLWIFSPCDPSGTAAFVFLKFFVGSVPFYTEKERERNDHTTSVSVDIYCGVQRPHDLPLLIALAMMPRHPSTNSKLIFRDLKSEPTSRVCKKRRRKPL